MNFDDKLMKRIWNHIDVTDDCWLSKYAINNKGYTSIGINKNVYRFNRVMLFWSDQTKIEEFTNCKIWLACHKCKNKDCVNPDHLYWGSPQDNKDDMIKDGTVMYGETHHQAKFTEKEVLEIREKYSKRGGISTYKLAKEYEVDPSTIQRIIKKQTWKHF